MKIYLLIKYLYHNVLITIPQIKPIKAIASANTSLINNLTNKLLKLACAIATVLPKIPTHTAANRLANPTAKPPNPSPYAFL